MRYLALLSLVSGCVLLGGTPAGDGDEDTRSRPRKITINWSLKNVDGTAAACPPSFTGMLVRVTEARCNAQENDLVTCASSGTFTRDIFT